jgi:ribonucleoside-diphosphate reductase alpha chain
MVKYGRRNIAILTIAPTGSVSILSQTTSGLEPVFAVTYKRRRKVNPNDKHARITFTDEIGDTWEEYNVFHHKFVTWLESKGTMLMKYPGWMKKN